VFGRLVDLVVTFPFLVLVIAIVAVLGPGLVNMYIAIAIVGWVAYARLMRAEVMVQRSADYVAAARVLGFRTPRILLRHILPNVTGPVLVIITINLALAIILEATLSFLGVGLPPTEPSLGTLIRIGNNYLFSGEWWIAIFPGITLVALVLAVNLVGDWLRDVLNPKLR
jgi:peptide/nickel transport system permease protein